MSSASATAVECRKTAVREIYGQMTMFARSGEWGEVNRLAPDLHAAIADVPAAERQELAESIRSDIVGLARAARQARTEVVGELGKLRKGQDATKAYELSQI